MAPIEPARTWQDRLVLFVAEGFGSGRTGVAPGTFGSLVGLLWTGLLLASGSWVTFVVATCVGLALSVALCGRAESILGRADPGSVVIDEIAALPVCFLGWCLWWHLRPDHGGLPGVRQWCSGASWWVPWAGFALFRLFDIWKPAPVRQSQRLPAGWGITIDDALAAVYVNAALVPLQLWLA